MVKFMIKNIIKIVSFISSFVMISIVCYLSYLLNNSFSGLTIYLFLLLLINPFRNIYSNYKKEINNPIYNFIVTIYSLIITTISIITILLYYSTYDINYGNYARNYFFDYLIYMLIGIILIHFLALLFKKNKKINKKNNSKLLFLFLAITSFFSLTADSINFVTAVNVGIAIFSLIMIKKLDSVNSKVELEKVYLLLLILSIFSLNIVVIVIILNMYIQLDKFSLTI